MRKRFRDRGNKSGAIDAFRELEGAGVGKLVAIKSDRGAKEVRNKGRSCTYWGPCLGPYIINNIHVTLRHSFSSLTVEGSPMHCSYRVGCPQVNKQWLLSAD